MQTTEEEERFRQIRQLSQFLRGGARIQVQSFQSKALVFSIVPCFLGLKRFGTRGCKNHIIGVLYPGGLQTSHDGALLPLKVVEIGVIHKVIRKEHCGLACSKDRDKEESEKRAHGEVFREQNQVPRKRKESRKMLRLWHWGSVGMHKWFRNQPPGEGKTLCSVEKNWISKPGRKFMPIIPVLGRQRGKTGLP